MRCPRCGNLLNWNSDFDGEDVGIEFPSIVTYYTCECGVTAEIVIPLEPIDKENLN